MGQHGSADTDSQTVDCRDQWLRKTGQRHDEPKDRGVFPEPSGFLEIGEIVATCEHAVGAGEDNNPNCRVVGRPLQLIGEPLVHGERQSVLLFGPADDDCAYLALVGRDDVFRLRCVHETPPGRTLSDLNTAPANGCS